MTNLSDHGENLAATALFGSGTFYIALHTADPGDATGANEVAAAGYARAAVTLTVAGAVAATAADAAFANQTSGADITITHASIWDAATGGDYLAAGPLSAARTYPNGGGFTIATGDFTVTFD